MKIRFTVDVTTATSFPLASVTNALDVHLRQHWHLLGAPQAVRVVSMVDLTPDDLPKEATP